MNFEVISIRSFDKQAKRLSKKFPSLKMELSSLISSLEKNPFQGKPIKFECYKIRLAIRSKGKGKSGGARIITNIFVQNKKVFLLTIYDKSELGTIEDKELLALLKEIYS